MEGAFLMITDSFEPFDLQQFEYAFLLEKTHSGSNVLKLIYLKLWLL
jgi:hypothetical protein